MSVKIMGAVWDSDLPQDEKFVALAYADHANHDGSDVYPSNSLIAWKTMYSVRQIQRIRNKLTERGVLIPIMENVGGRSISNRYYFNTDALPKRAEWRVKNHDILSPFSNQKHDISDTNHDIAMSENHDIAESYDPSLTVKEPSLTREKNFSKNDNDQLTTVGELLEEHADEYWQEDDLPE